MATAFGFALGAFLVFFGLFDFEIVDHGFDLRFEKVLLDLVELLVL